MKNLYTGQLGQIQGDAGDSRVFPITAGCAKPKVIHSHSSMGHATVENYASGIDLQHDESKLLDLRFADDLLLFARTEFETIFMLETLWF